VFDKTGWEGRDQQLGGSHGHSLDPVPSPGPGKENDYALESLDGYILWCCWELKRKFRLRLRILPAMGIHRCRREEMYEHN
jgi:hypothetical protein